MSRRPGTGADRWARGRGSTGGSVTDLAGVDLTQANDPLRGGIGVGGSYNWDEDGYSIFGEASVVTSLTNPASGHALHGNIGLRVRW